MLVSLLCYFSYKLDDDTQEAHLEQLSDLTLDQQTDSSSNRQWETVGLLEHGASTNNMDSPELGRSKDISLMAQAIELHEKSVELEEAESSACTTVGSFQPSTEQHALQQIPVTTAATTPAIYRLPVEIRLMIFKYCLQRDTEIRFRENWQRDRKYVTWGIPPEPLQPNILQVSRLFYNEGSMILYGGNEFLCFVEEPDNRWNYSASIWEGSESEEDSAEEDPDESCSPSSIQDVRDNGKPQIAFEKHRHQFRKVMIWYDISGARKLKMVLKPFAAGSSQSQTRANLQHLVINFRPMWLCPYFRYDVDNIFARRGQRNTTTGLIRSIQCDELELQVDCTALFHHLEHVDWRWDLGIGRIYDPYPEMYGLRIYYNEREPDGNIKMRSTLPHDGRCEPSLAEHPEFAKEFLNSIHHSATDAISNFRRYIRLCCKSVIAKTPLRLTVDDCLPSYPGWCKLKDWFDQLLQDEEDQLNHNGEN